MKQTLVLFQATFFVFLLLFNSCKQKNNGYTINGSLSNAEDLKVYLTDRSFSKSKGFKDFYFDSCVVSNGKFQFGGFVDEPTVYSIVVEGVKSWKAFIIENTEINISGSVDSLNKAVISGSDENELRKKYKAGVNSINKKSYNLLQERNQAYQMGDTLRFQELKTEMQNLSLVRDSFTIEFIKENPGSLVSLLYFPSYTKIIDPKELFEGLDEEIKQHSWAKRTYNKIHGKLISMSVGDDAIDFSLPDTNGIKVSISSFKNQYLLIDFWASWCGPCRAENPNLINVYTQYHDQGFEILGVSLDIDRKPWINAIGEDKLIWPQVSDLNGIKSPIAREYGVFAIPMNVLLDKEGKILSINLRGGELQEYLNNLYN